MNFKKNIILFIILSIFISLSVSNSYSSPIKTYSLYNDTIPTINTSPNFSTVIELEDKPTKIIIGDQSSFKVELTGTEVVIKPHRFGAKTNLIIFTTNDRFQLTIISGRKENVDYVVKLRRKDFITKTINETYYNKNGFKLTLHEVKISTGSGHKELKLTLTNLSSQTVTLKYEDTKIELSDSVIEVSRIRSKTNVLKPHQNISLKLEFNLTELNESFITIAFQSKKEILFLIPAKVLKGI